jgi:hypothetical protein
LVGHEKSGIGLCLPITHYGYQSLCALTLSSTNVVHNLLFALVSQANRGFDEIARTASKMLHNSFFAVV